MSVVAEWSCAEEEVALATGRALLFQLRGHTYAISVDFVSKVIELADISLVPGAQPWLVGVVVHDYLPYPLIAPAKLIAADESGVGSPSADAELTRAIVVKSAHGNVMIGVEQLVTISELAANSRVEVNRPEFPQPYVEYVCRADENLIGVISVPQLLQAAALSKAPLLKVPLLKVPLLKVPKGSTL